MNIFHSLDTITEIFKDECVIFEHVCTVLTRLTMNVLYLSMPARYLPDWLWMCYIWACLHGTYQIDTIICLCG